MFVIENIGETRCPLLLRVWSLVFISFLDALEIAWSCFSLIFQSIVFHLLYL